jgi:small subunit ribosomal protein S1
MASTTYASRHSDAPTYSGPDDFAALLDAALGAGAGFEGSVVSGIVLRIDDDFVIVDVGLKTEGRVALREFAGPGRESDLKVGDEVEVFSTASRTRSAKPCCRATRRAARKLGQAREGLQQQREGHGVIFNQVKGGFTVDLDGAVAFLPRSQVDIRPIRDVAPLMNNSQPFQILKMDRRRGNIVVSRRTVLEETRAEQRQELVPEPRRGSGHRRRGQEHHRLRCVRRPRRHRRPAARHRHRLARVNHPTEVLTIGQTVKVKIIKINHETHRISLGMKQLLDDPWQGIEAKYPLGRRASPAASPTSPTTARSSSWSRASKA